MNPSETVALPDKARALRQAGVDVIDLSEGEPYFDTPEKIKLAAKEALDEGFVHYVSSAGLKELRQAVAEKLRTENKIDVQESEVIVTVGAKQALFTAFLTVLNPGDEVLIPEPGYVSYQAMVIVAGGKQVSVNLLETRDFRLDEEEIKEKITEKTKAVILNSPNNPVGAVFPKEDLKMIADIAKDCNLLVITDEIYEKIVYDGVQHYSIASFPEMKDRTITVNGFSKAYSMTGWRLGYAAAKKEIIDNMLKVQQHSVTHPTSFVEKAGIVALKECEEEVKWMVKAYKECRDYFVNELNKTDKLSCWMPKGAFYAFPKIVETKFSSEEFAEYLLKEAHVLAVPGTAFGDLGRGYARMVYSRPMDELEEAIPRIRSVLEKL
ncbi:MAG: pyridoxal phosphate-dependent aminotransferase [Candidatus Bathyarchaeota archaeon]|nr:pyridoxal phosphate-dependent aminotransferase [Candidatus Bathyarchaeota archaeon]